jgi:hypothetical protein
VLCWLFTWNEFLFALILTGNKVPMITVVMAQFVTEMGLRWNLMAATAVLALLPAFLLALFGQKYVIRVAIYSTNTGGDDMLRWEDGRWLRRGLRRAAGGAMRRSRNCRIGYQPSPIQDASIAMFETWGAKNGIKIVKVPNSYGVYVEKMTASLTSNSDQYDVIWHNDDWGQLWAHLLEPTDDIDALKYASKWGMDKIVFGNARARTPSCRWARPSASSSIAATW